MSISSSRYAGLKPGDKIDGWTWLTRSDLPAEDQIDDTVEERRLQEHRGRSQEALEHYKATKGEDYEVVDIVNHCLVYLGPYTCWHFNFEAKNRADNSTKFFFVEFCETYIRGYREIRVNYCDILDPSSAVRGCASCEDFMLHPTSYKIKYPDFWGDVEEE